jgi:hypothetical protein
VGIGDEESEDLRAIRRDIERNRLSGELWDRIYPDGDQFRRDFDKVAKAAQDWDVASYADRFRALRILMRRFGREDTYLLTLMAAPKSHQDWKLQLRKRKDTEKTDRGRRHKNWEREHWDHIIGREVYERIKAGQSKSDAIAAVKEDYRLGNPIALKPVGDFPPLILKREVRHLPADDGKNNGMDKILNRFRRAVRARGYVDPSAASGIIAYAREPDLKLSDIPSRGRPRKK